MGRFLANGREDRQYGSSGRATGPDEPGSYTISGPSFDTSGRAITTATTRRQDGTASGKVIRFVADGQIDRTFVDNGPFANGSSSIAYTSKVLASGKIVVAGIKISLPGFSGFLSAARLNSDGNPDIGFAGGGVATVSHYYTPTRLAEQSDGKLLFVALDTYANSASANSVVGRFNVDGSLDTSFGVGGLYSIQLAGFLQTNAYALTVAPDGKIVVAGTVFEQGSGVQHAMAVRLTSSGKLDTSFASAGYLVDTSSWLSVALDARVISDGTTLIGGGNFQTPESYGTGRIWAFTPAGTPDSSVGQGGVADVAVGADNGDIITGLGVDSSGHWIVTGNGQIIFDAESNDIRFSYWAVRMKGRGPNVQECLVDVVGVFTPLVCGVTAIVRRGVDNLRLLDFIPHP